MLGVMATPGNFIRVLHVSVCCLVLACAGQMVNTGSSQQLRDAQTCAANLACGLNYSDIYQAKLDNLSHYVDLEVALLRFMVSGNLQPLQLRLDTLESNQTTQMAAVNTVLQTLRSDVFNDRNTLNNVTTGLYGLSGEFHKENMNRNQDINRLVLQLNDARHQLASLQNTVNALISAGNASMLPVSNAYTGTNKAHACIDKDKTIADLQNNLTYYMNAYTSSQKTMENIRTLETFLQSQVVGLKANLTSVETANTIKDKVIVNLQQQLQTLRQNPAAVTVPGSCGAELGMRNGLIPNTAIVASESQPGHGPENARLDNTQGWYTADKDTSQDFLQIDTGSLHYITKVATQGAPCCDVMVTNYTLQYSNDGQTWREYKRNCDNVYFSGNSDTNTIVEHNLPEPIAARFVRFYVENFRKDSQSNYVGMRVEMYGCSGSGP